MTFVYSEWQYPASYFKVRIERLKNESLFFISVQTISTIDKSEGTQ